VVDFRLLKFTYEAFRGLLRREIKDGKIYVTLLSGIKMNDFVEREMKEIHNH